VSITLNTASTPCTGVASNGTLDAFDGGCAGIGYTCTSPSLPGTLTCTYPGLNPCTTRICDAGPAAVIQLRKVKKVYPGDPPVLQDVTLKVDKGEFIWLTGPPEPARARSCGSSSPPSSPPAGKS